MILTPAEKRRIASGSYRPIVRKDKPDAEPGDWHVLIWSRPERSAWHEPTGEVQIVRHPREPLLEITVTEVVRRRKGGWLVRFSVRDRRDRPRYLRRLPPVGIPGAPGNEDEARLEGAYTHSPVLAIDNLECVDELSLKRITADSHAKQAQRVGTLLAVCEELRETVRTEMENDPEFRKFAGRNVWLLRSRLDALMRDLKRKTA